MRICTYSFNCFYALQTGCLHVRKSSMASTHVLQICLRLLYVYRYVYIYIYITYESVCVHISKIQISSEEVLVCCSLLVLYACVRYSLKPCSQD